MAVAERYGNHGDAGQGSEPRGAHRQSGGSAEEFYGASTERQEIVDYDNHAPAPSELLHGPPQAGWCRKEVEPPSPPRPAAVRHDESEVTGQTPAGQHTSPRGVGDGEDAATFWQPFLTPAVNPPQHGRLFSDEQEQLQYLSGQSGEGDVSKGAAGPARALAKPCQGGHLAVAQPQPLSGGDRPGEPVAGAERRREREVGKSRKGGRTHRDSHNYTWRSAALPTELPPPSTKIEIQQADG